ncbi:serine hydrolase [Brevibacillus reuszeri]|uniref:Penicillin-binding protein n=1 Tax=Brevibacillus reuszeri TaxID=54915 RepID=A0A0K9YML3_9BACL|nr:serine hydrolase domain-containing protein [Brevibacillus reuszeri]KNB69993.1 penicillin-binding protein [Brevibacillus reuszeri]MED1858362.1 serine hydrolase [Brevibacillus reuszeri]GED68638.1 serine hydrolase [Brevibacillus reuszeri]
MNRQGWESTFEELAEKVIKESRAPGIVIGVNQDGKSLYRKGFGYRDAEQKLEITPDTVMGLASVTKSFTCMAIMQLQEAGKLSIHDPVLAYLPGFRTPDRQKTEQMTIHHFMTHSAGLPPLPVDLLAIKNSLLDTLPAEANPIHRFLKREDQKPIHTYQEFIEVLSRVDYELLGSPGQHFSYSNDGYSLLGAIIAEVSGKPYDVYVKEHILEPANMPSSTFLLSDLPHFPDVTTIYHIRDNQGVSEVYPDPHWEDGPAVAASGHLNSTVRDMLNYAEIFRTGGMVGKERILSEESVKQMTRPHIQCNYKKYYGYGLMVEPNYYGATLLKHGGAIKGVAAHLTIVPERGITAVALANLVGTPVEKLSFAALNLLAGREADVPLVTYEEYRAATNRFTEYVGRFVSGEGMDISITIEDSVLTLVNNTAIFTSDQGAKYPLVQIAEDYFLARMDGSELTIGFTSGEDGKVKAVAFGYRQIPKVSYTEV